MTLTALLLFLAAPIILLNIDAVGATRARKRMFRYGNFREDNFAVLVPIYGSTAYLENIDYLHSYGTRVALCTTSGESDQFYRELYEIAEAHGFYVFKSSITRSAGNGKRATSGTIRDRIIREALHHVEAPYVVCIDADTTTARDLSVLIGEIKTRDFDVASVRIVVRDGKGWLTKLQQLEYRLSMQFRFIAPWMVSGACHAGKTEVLRDVMDRHSLFFQGNDVETGLIASELGYNVGHVPFEVLTTAPDTLKGWFRQRLAWAGGEFRLFITNIRFITSHPFLWVYGAVITIALFPMRWVTLVHPGWALLAVLVLYLGLATFVHIKHWSAWALIVPFYTLFSSIIMTPLGAIWYFYMAIKDRNFGVIRPRRGQHTAPQTTA